MMRLEKVLMNWALVAMMEMMEAMMATVVTHLWTRSCSAFNNQQGFPNSILVLVILKSDLALPHVWLEKVVFGEKRCLNQTPTFFQTKVSEWIFSLTQRFLQLA